MRDALDKLIEAVERGEPNRNDGTLFRLFGDDWIHAWDVIDRGSLDAAKALHDALLPGWEWGRAPGGMMWVHGSGSGIPPQWGNGIAARAWLLAVLRAYRQQMEDRDA